jgi:predicted lipid-binding transport protein (Tim44 family)
MGTALSIIAVVILLGLLVMSAKRQREQRAADKAAVAQAYTGEAEAQYARSMRRRDSVRAAHAERTRAEASDPEAERANPN